MIAWSRRHTLVAGVALILLVNATILAGVAGNRSGDPTSRLQLSERELRLPYGGRNNTENSGVTLNLVWRVSGVDEPERIYAGDESSGGAPAWLDRAKLAALGFDVADDQARKPAKRWRTREVLLVLEFDGLSHRQALARAQKNADDQQKLALANPGHAEFERRAKQAGALVAREQYESSRLFVVDAGLDAEALRRQYPDRAHALLMRGQIRPQLLAGRAPEPRLAGYVSALSIGQINVPVKFQPALRRDAATNRAAPFEATLAVGQRLEPWLVSVAEQPAAKRGGAEP